MNKVAFRRTPRGLFYVDRGGLSPKQAPVRDYHLALYDISPAAPLHGAQPQVLRAPHPAEFDLPTSAPPARAVAGEEARYNVLIGPSLKAQVSPTKRAQNNGRTCQQYNQVVQPSQAGAHKRNRTASPTHYTYAAAGAGAAQRRGPPPHAQAERTPVRVRGVGVDVASRSPSTFIKRGGVPVQPAASALRFNRSASPAK